MRHKATLLSACACALAALAGAASLQADPGPQPPETTTTTTDATAASQVDAVLIQRVIQQQRHETWHWERVMGRQLTRALQNPPDDPQLRLDAWRKLAHRMRHRALHPPNMRAWLCIHHYEGSWTDAGPVYYGGLQMDLGFQERYGAPLLRRKGTANHWTPLEQIWTAERARRSGRGFYPWPNTARFCGLI
jgi:hypothetical protein